MAGRNNRDFCGIRIAFGDGIWIFVRIALDSLCITKRYLWNLIVLGHDVASTSYICASMVSDESLGISTKPSFQMAWNDKCSVDDICGKSDRKLPKSNSFGLLHSDYSIKWARWKTER